MKFIAAALFMTIASANAEVNCFQETYDQVDRETKQPYSVDFTEIIRVEIGKLAAPLEKAKQKVQTQCESKLKTLMIDGKIPNGVVAFCGQTDIRQTKREFIAGTSIRHDTYEISKQLYYLDTIQLCDEVRSCRSDMMREKQLTNVQKNQVKRLADLEFGLNCLK